MTMMGRINERWIAKMAHEVNKAYCEANGDYSQPPWSEASEEQRESAINGVLHYINRECSPKESHDNWMLIKEANDWKWGPVKDEEKKEHPCLVPYESLPQVQKVKDYLFIGVVRACIGEENANIYV